MPSTHLLTHGVGVRDLAEIFCHMFWRRLCVVKGVRPRGGPIFTQQTHAHKLKQHKHHKCSQLRQLHQRPAVATLCLQLVQWVNKGILNCLRWCLPDVCIDALHTLLKNVGHEQASHPQKECVCLEAWVLDVYHSRNMYFLKCWISTLASETYWYRIYL